MEPSPVSESARMRERMPRRARPGAMAQDAMNRSSAAATKKVQIIEMRKRKVSSDMPRACRYAPIFWLDLDQASPEAE